MATTVLPLALGTVELPDRHPRASSGSCLIQGFAVAHPDGIIVVDTVRLSHDPTVLRWHR